MRLALVALLVLASCTKSPVYNGVTHPTPEEAHAKILAEKPVSKFPEAYYIMAPRLAELEKAVNVVRIEPDPERAFNNGNENWLWYLTGYKSGCYGFGATLAKAVEDAFANCDPAGRIMYEKILAKQFSAVAESGAK